MPLEEREPDGETVLGLTSSSNGRPRPPRRRPTRIWDVPVEVCSVASLNGHHYPLWATGSTDGTVRVWGRPDGVKVAPLVSSFFADPKCLTTGYPLVMAWDASCMKLQCTGGSASVLTWDVASERVAHTLTMPSEGTSLACAPGALSVCGTRNGQVVLFDWRAGSAPVRVWQEHGASSAILGVGISAGSPDSPLAWTQVMGAASDGRVLFWDLRAPAHSTRSMSIGGAVRSVAVHALRGHLAAGTDKGVSVYSYTGALVSNVRFFDGPVAGQALGPVNRVAFHPFFAEVACGLPTGETVVLSE